MTNEQEVLDFASEYGSISLDDNDTPGSEIIMFGKDDFIAFAQAIRDQEAAKVAPQWQPIESAPSGVPVLVFYINAYGKSRVIKARHIARFTEEASCYYGEEGVDEYDEANDRYTYCEGWWEIIDNWEDYGFVAVHEGTPTYWMPLPADPELRNANEV